MSFTDAELTACHPAVLRYARRLTRDPGAAHDLAQSVMLRALEKRDLYRLVPGQTLIAWLMTITHHTHVNAYRRALRRGEVLFDPDDLGRLPSPARDPIIAIEVREMSAHLARLPRVMQRLLILAAVHGENYAAMAKHEQVPTGAVRSRLSRAREHLRMVVGGTALSAAERDKLGAAA